MKNKSLIDMMLTHQNHNGYILDITTGESVDYRQLYHRVFQRATWLQSFQQQKICVILPNGLTYIELLLASFISNNAFCPIPYMNSDAEIAQTLDFLEPAVVVSDRITLSNLGEPKWQFVVPEKARRAADIDMSEASFCSDSAAIIFPLSSPSDNRRAVMVSHKNIQIIVSTIIESFGHTQDSSFLAFLPFDHAAAIYYSILPAIASGAHCVIAQGFEYLRSDFFTILGQHNISHCQVVPTILTLLLEFDVIHNPAALKMLKFIGCGSADLNLNLQQKFMDHYGIPVANLYGLTETGPTHFDNPLEPGWIPGSIGRPLACNDTRVAEDGELLIRGDNLFINYYKNEKLYQESFDGDWFKTGDLIRVDKDGLQYFSGRKKALIIKGGINIDPREVEEIILELPVILACFVVGRYNVYYGEELVAAVVPAEQMERIQLQKLIQSHCIKYLSPHKIPLEVIVQSDLPSWTVDAWHQISQSIEEQ